MLNLISGKRFRVSTRDLKMISKLLAKTSFYGNRHRLENLAVDRVVSGVWVHTKNVLTGITYITHLHNSPHQSESWYMVMDVDKNLQETFA